MSSTEADISAFISDLAVHYTTPKYDDPKDRQRWLKSFVVELRGASPEVLKRAAQLIINSRKNRYFPLVADCRQAVREAAELVKFEQRLQTLPTLRQALGDEWSQERRDLADQLIKSGLGKEAANDGWILALWDFCRRFQRLPDDQRYEARNAKEAEDFAGCSELKFCKRAACGFDEAYQQCLRGGWPQAYELKRLGDSMIAKRERLCQEVLGR